MQKSLAQINHKVGYLDRDGIGYRKTRATAVLASCSNVIRAAQDTELTAVLAKLREKNFELARLKDSELEYVFAYFDEDMTGKIISEFRFVPELGSIRDLKRAEGHCDLCGKGDSRDDGGNEDKLRYQFKLANHAGGQDIWVGSTCIWQHGLHVDGAANADEARRFCARRWPSISSIGKSTSGATSILTTKPFLSFGISIDTCLTSAATQTSFTRCTVRTHWVSWQRPSSCSDRFAQPASSTRAQVG